MQETRGFDAFISYRHRDGAALAHYLARSLRRYRLPLAVRQRLERNRRQPLQPLRIYLDKSRAKATAERHEQEIRPALLDADHLIIVASPSVAKPRRSGEPNRVDRETRDFLRLRRGRSLLAVHARGAREPGLPPSLGPHPRVDMIDLGVPAPWRVLWAPAARRTRYAVHRCGAALYNVPHEQMEHVERAVKRNENMRGALRALAALAVLAGVLALFSHRAGQESRNANKWTAEARSARERGDAAAGARAVLDALALRPTLPGALIERLAWQPSTPAEAPWARTTDRFRVEALTPDGLLVGSVRSAADSGGLPDGRVKGLPREARSPKSGVFNPTGGTWTAFEPGVVAVHTAEPAARGVWVAAAADGAVTLRSRVGGEVFLRFALPAGQSLQRVALHVSSKRCWVATRDEGGAAQRLPLGRIYSMPPEGEALQLVKAERSIAASLQLSRDGERVLWSLLTGIVRATTTDLEKLTIQSPVPIGMGIPVEAGFLGSTQRIVVVDPSGVVRRETKPGSADLERVLARPIAGVGPVVSAAFHPEAAVAAVAARDGVTLVMLDGQAAEALHVPLDGNGPIAGMAFTPDGLRLAVTDRIGRLRLVGPTDAELQDAAR